MDDVTVARALHVLSIVLWIGGVGFVTTVLLPSVRRLKAPQERIGFFDAVERRFAWQARIWTGLAGGSGPYNPARPGLWGRFPDVPFLGGHAGFARWVVVALGGGVAAVHRGALCRGAAVPAPLVACASKGEAASNFQVAGMAALGLAHPRFGHRCRRGRRHPRSAAVRMIGKRGRSHHSFFNGLNREPGEDPASPRSCFRGASWGMAGESPRRRGTSVSTTV